MPFVAPIHAMNVALFASTGADVTSAFHQLSAGKSGSGPGERAALHRLNAAAARGERREAAGRGARSAASLVVAIDVQDEVERAGRVVLHVIRPCRPRRGDERRCSRASCPARKLIVDAFGGDASVAG